MSGQLLSQPKMKPVNKPDIYNADELIKYGLKYGVAELCKLTDPSVIILLDKSYADKLIKMEFKEGFVEKYYQRKNLYIKRIPELTLTIAHQFGINNAKKKIFEYYCSIPKGITSDTIYDLYHDLNKVLDILVIYQSSSVIKRLVDDYHVWRDLIKTTPKIKYSKDGEIRNGNSYNDCRYITLQLAGALCYLNVKGFDQDLLNYLISIQSSPMAKYYSIPEPIWHIFDVTKYSKKMPITKKSKSPITSFRKDYKLIWKLIEKGGEYGKDSEIEEFIFKGNLAYIRISGSAWYNDYLVKIINKNAIAVAMISGLTGSPDF